MALAKITSISGTAVSVPGDDIDTDRIIPARFMKCVTFDELGQYYFYDVRKNSDGSDKKHPLNEHRFEGASILISGNNFGCGSSREHAPQALFRAGFQAVIAEGFAEIFFGNSTQLGIPCVSGSKEDLATLSAMIDKDPSLEVTIDLENLQVTAGDFTFPINIKDGARKALLNGKWDPITDLLGNEADIQRVADALPYV